eukprot:10767339-Alexandrium_andersonii.AAC.1
MTAWLLEDGLASSFALLFLTQQHVSIDASASLLLPLRAPPSLGRLLRVGRGGLRIGLLHGAGARAHLA